MRKKALLQPNTPNGSRFVLNPNPWLPVELGQAHGSVVLKLFVGGLRQFADLTKCGTLVVRQALKVEHRRAKFEHGPKYFGFARSSKACEHDIGSFRTPGLEYASAVGFVATFPAVHFVSGGAEQPSHGSAALAPAPAVDFDGRGVALDAGIDLCHQISHSQPSVLEAQAHRFGGGLLLVHGSDFGPLAVAE